MKLETVKREQSGKGKKKRYKKKPPTPASDRALRKALSKKPNQSREEKGPTPKQSPKSHKRRIQDLKVQKRQDLRKSKKQRFSKKGGSGLTRFAFAASSTNVKRQAEANPSLIPALGPGQQVGCNTTTTKLVLGKVTYAEKKSRRKKRSQGRGFHPMSHPTWVG